MIGLSRSLFLNVVSRAAGWLISTLFRCRALFSIRRARERDVPVVLDTEGRGGRGSLP
jgi:hypothetical protein